MKLNDLIPAAELADALAEGLVRTQVHPTYPMKIYNYTDKAVVSRTWHKATLFCRGLVVDSLTDEIMARPFPKFFHHNEWGHAPGVFDIRSHPDARVEVTDKLDGSLGILYLSPNRIPLIATRGSFVSEQAIHASMVLSQKYPRFNPPKGKTLLFEIVYPRNRIVLDYGDTDDLILLGSVDIETGRSAGPGSVPDWPGPRAKEFPYRTLREALEAPPRPNAEGLVVHFIERDLRVKIKQEDYVQLHKIVFGLNEHVVWERMSTMTADADVFAGVPDEFHEWVGKVADRLMGEQSAYEFELESTWAALEEAGMLDASRGMFARSIMDKPAWLKSCLFAWLDGQLERAVSIIWKQVEPKKDNGPR